MIDVQMKNGKIVITVDTEKNPQPSASEKTLVIVNPHGNIATYVTIDSKPFIAGVNAYVYQ